MSFDEMGDGRPETYGELFRRLRIHLRPENFPDPPIGAAHGLGLAYLELSVKSELGKRAAMEVGTNFSDIEQRTAELFLGLIDENILIRAACELGRAVGANELKNCSPLILENIRDTLTSIWTDEW